MTKKEYILDFLKEINYAYNHPAMYDDLKRLLDEMEEEILESANCKWIQRAVLDKVRSEVTAITINGQVDEHTMFIRTGEQVKQMALEIIDKYTAEGSEKECTKNI